MEKLQEIPMEQKSPAAKKARNQEWFDYFIFACRLVLAYVFLDYGYSKFTGNQFGVTAGELSTPLQDLSLFRVSWYVFGHQPFKAFIGISQFICAFLLLYNRTIILAL